MTGDQRSGLEVHEDYPEIIVVICILAVFTISGTIGNSFVLYVYSRKKEKTTTTIFILALAGTDFFTCLVIVPFTIVVEYVAKKIQYDSACKIYQFLITSNVPFSAFVMVIIAFDRYLKICRPWNHTLDSKMAKKIIGFLFTFAVVLGIITSLAHGVHNFANKDVNVYSLSMNDSNITANTKLMSTHGTEDIMHSNFSLTTIAPAPVSQSDYVSNITQLTIMQRYLFENELKSRYNGKCTVSEMFISTQMRNIFQKFYASLFLISFILVVILYGMVFHSLAVRRARKCKKTFVSENAAGHTATAGQQLLAINACTFATKSTMTENFDVTSTHIQNDCKDQIRLKRSKSAKEKHRIANLKTAGILFIVTIVFIVAFLPAWLMAMRAIRGNIIVFYMHFSYNVANPIIYAFFNANFRKEIKRDCGLFISFEKQLTI